MVNIWFFEPADDLFLHNIHIWLAEWRHVSDLHHMWFACEFPGQLVLWRLEKQHRLKRKHCQNVIILNNLSAIDPFADRRVSASRPGTWPHISDLQEDGEGWKVNKENAV